MKIFYYFPERDTTNMTLWQRVHFFDELLYHGIEIEPFNPLLCNSWDEANNNALTLLKKGNYDLFFTSVCQKECLFPDTLQEIKRMGIPSLCLRFDNLVIPYYDKELSPFFDLVWLTAKETKRLYDKWGARTCFAPYAANPYAFKYIELPIKRELCFIGTPYGSRSRMINALAKGGIDMTLFFGKSPTNDKDLIEEINPLISVPLHNRLGSVFTRLRFREGRVLIHGLVKNRIVGKREILECGNLQIEPSVCLNKLHEVYSQYTLSLASTSAHHTDVLKHPLKIVNLRSFEIPMSGGIEICRNNPELAEYFEESKEIIFYDTMEELVEKADYYIRKASEQEIRSIKTAARRRAEGEHTWYHRFSKVLAELDLKI